MKDSRERLRNFLSEHARYRSYTPIQQRIIRDSGEDLILEFRDLTSDGGSEESINDCTALIGGRRLG